MFFSDLKGAAIFNMDYAQWVEEQNRKLSELRSALNGHMGDNELRTLVDSGMAHYDELFRLKGVAVKADVFHIVSGMWKTPAERCFMWMGGFRPSELLKVLSTTPFTFCFCIATYISDCAYGGDMHSLLLYLGNFTVVFVPKI